MANSKFDEAFCTPFEVKSPATSAMHDKAIALEAEIARLREALEWYADPKQWNGYYGNTDNGKRAREALGK